jgi:transcriptional regulator with XRE-family HTH domain
MGQANVTASGNGFAGVSEREAVMARSALESAVATEIDQAAVPEAPIDLESADAFLAEKRIGARIRKLRLKMSMGLVELGKHSGLSASFLSQLETGRVIPTLRNLARISMVFSKDLSYFFEPEPQTLFRVHRAEDRMRLPQSGVDDPTYFFESLGYLVPDRQLDPYLAIFEPKPDAKQRLHRHAGCEFLYVVEGRLRIQHGDITYELESNDSVYFDATTAHSYACAGETPARAILVTLQQPVGSTAPLVHFNATRMRSGNISTAVRSPSAVRVPERGAAAERRAG